MNYKLANSSWGVEEINAIHRVIDNDMFSMGSEVDKYEREFSKFFGSKYSIMCSSGSAANLLMISSLFFKKKNPIKRGDEIIVPSVSWSTTYFPLQQYGLKVKFIDIDINTLNYDLDVLENSITNKTKIILAVNLLGNPNNFARIKKIIKDKNIILLEDNCESMGAMFENKYTGTFGLMGTFSSFFSHHISTMEGGVVITDDEELYHIMLCLRAHGWTRNLPKKNMISNKSDNWFKESFRFVLPGYNLRPLEMSGAIGLEQLKKLPNFLKQREKNALLFNELFKNDERFYIQKEIGKSSWFGFSFIIKSEIDRNFIINKLTENNIESRPIVTGDFTKNDVIKYFNHEIFGKLKNSKLLDKNGFFVGNSQDDLRKELNYLHKVLKNI